MTCLHCFSTAGPFVPPSLGFGDDLSVEQLELVGTKRIIANVSKILALFASSACHCGQERSVQGNTVGCVLEVKWWCRGGHIGEWSSSEKHCEGMKKVGVGHIYPLRRNEEGRGLAYLSIAKE